MVAGVVIVLLAGVGGFFAWKHFSAKPPPQTVAPTPNPKPKPPAATATTEAPKPTPAPASGESESTPEVPSKPQAPAKVVLDPTPRTPQQVSAEASGVAPTPLAPGVTAKVAPAMTTADASPAFRAFVANVKITGVFQGNPARAMINGRTYRAGEYVDTSLGVIFDSVDIEKKQIVFRDKNDVTIRRKY